MLGSDLAAPDWLVCGSVRRGPGARPPEALGRNIGGIGPPFPLAVVVLQLGLYGRSTSAPTCPPRTTSFLFHQDHPALVPLGILAIAALGREMINGWRIRAGM